MTTQNLPPWILSQCWPDGVSVESLLGGADEKDAGLTPGIKAQVKSVWDQRLKEAQLLRNEVAIVNARRICAWLASASDELSVLIFGKQQRAMLVDTKLQKVLPM